MTPPVSDRRRGPLSRGRWLLFVCPLACLGIALGTLRLRHPSYTATALTRVNTDNVATRLGLHQDDSGGTPAQKHVRYLRDLLLDGEFLRSALADARLGQPINLDPSAEDPRSARLRERATPFVQSDALFGIRVTWDDPAEAEQIAQAIQRRYRAEIGEERAAQSVETLSFLQSQIRDYANRLDAEENLQAAAARLRPGDPASGRLAQQIRTRTRDYPVLVAMYRHLLMLRERQTFAASLARVAGSSSLIPIAYVRAEPTTDPSDARRDGLVGVTVGLLLAGLLLAVARGGAAVAGSVRRAPAVQPEAGS